jgi:hypothetical protein
MAAVILVTGGSGLVGKAIQHVVDVEPLDSRFGKRQGETWIFTGSSDADLRSVTQSVSSTRLSSHNITEILLRQLNCSRNTNPLMLFTWLPLVRRYTI